MYLYSLTLQPATGINKAIYGNFSTPKVQEIVISRGKILELLRPDENSGQLKVIYSQEVFGLIRTLCAFRMTGANRDLLVVGSDSGRIAFFEFNTLNNKFEIVHLETYGKTGCRRIVPGQYIASDPKGRAVMIAAIEKQKFVYILNRDTNNRITISSPLEAHKNRTIIFEIIGVDVGFDNPQFAVLEVDYGDFEDPESAVCNGNEVKLLTFYEMDLGLNVVVLKYGEPIDSSANLIITVPGGADGPGGVLVCCENFILWRKPGYPEIRTHYPRREDMANDRGLLMICYASYKQKDLFFFLIQSELGDLYKVTIVYSEDRVNGITVQYFDTIFPCVSICVLKTGFLFAAAEFGNHALYQFQSIKDDEISAKNYSDTTNPVFFMPQKLTNLYHLYEMESLSAITAMHVSDLTGEGTPQIYTLCGRGPRSTLRVLRHGLGVSEMASSQLPGKPSAVWTVKSSFSDSEEVYDKYIVISFLNATLVLGVGNTVTEVTNSGFDSQKPTVHVGLLATSAIIQVIHTGIRHICPDGRVETWESPSKISKATSNERQVVISLQGGILIYFELDGSGSLRQVQKKEMEQEVTCMNIASIPEGRIRARFLAVGCYDNTIKILSLDPEGCLGRLSTQALPASQAESVCLIEMGHSAEDKEIYLNVGLGNGVLLRTVVDTITGQLSDTRARYLGSRGVRLHKVQVQGTPALAALSSRPWLCYNYMSRHLVTPLSYETLEYMSSFSSEMCIEGMVAISGNTLRIFVLEQLGELFNQSVLSLTYTPRKLEINPQNNHLYILESDHNSFTLQERQRIKQALNVEEDLENELTEARVGVPQAGLGRWASCIRIVDPIKMDTVEILELDNNECIVSLCITTFSGYETDLFLVVGVAKDMILHPRNFSAAYVGVYVIRNNSLILVHKTPVEDVPLAICPFYGKILIGVGKLLRIYELGKAKLLKKCENKIVFPALISSIKVDGERIFTTDLSESFSVFRWKREENQLYCFADDVVPRWITASCILDHDTIAGVDKFENFYVVRIPAACAEDEDDPAAVKYKWESGYLNGAYYKMDHIVHYFIGDMASCIQKTQLSDSSNEVLIYGTTMGAIGVFLPMTNKDDIEFFVHLEMHMRIESPSISGRDHMSFRSFYQPVKDVVDGDLCEQFVKMDYSRQRLMSEELERTPNEILKKLEEFRNRIL